MNKMFFTYDQQLDKLQNEKQLIITNRTYAKNILEKISYYSLIGGYKSLFKHAPSGNYRRGVTFEEIVAFYYFDEKLRSVFLKYILHVERHMKSMISYFFCEKYGDNQTAYLTKTNYNFSSKNISDIERLIKSLKKTIAIPSNYVYITHHVKEHGNVPLWVVVNALTFGQISKMYQYAPTDIRTKISKRFVGVTEKQLHQMITIIGRCRNVCAHGERLYSFRIRETIPDMLLHNKLKIRRKNNQYVSGKNDLFAVVIALRYLLEKDDFQNFKRELTLLINCVLRNCSHTFLEVNLNKP